MSETYLLQVDDLCKHFSLATGFGTKTGTIKAVDGVSFDVRPGETMGLVGESGSGKSTVARVVLRLYDPTSGKILFQDRDITGLNSKEMRPIRRDMQVIFQDPYSSLNPRLRVIDIVAEPLATHLDMTRKEREERVKEIFDVVGLKQYHLSCYPHQFSGGQRQRIGIARALTLQPKLIICDEPVSALDVSIQSQILNLLNDLQEKFDLTYLFISHDLHVVKHMSSRICVMYLGKIVEQGPTDELFDNPRHPYTKSLVSVAPIADPTLRDRERILLQGELPSAVNPPSGCRFRTRCPLAAPICAEKEPEVRSVGKDHTAACHMMDKV